MADIDQIIAGGAGASSRATIPDFSGILDSFYKGRDQAYQQQGRDLFQGGVPMVNGQPDFAAMGKALFQHGDVGQGVALSNLDLQRQGIQQNREAAGYGATGIPGGASQPAPDLPPSVNRSAPAVDARPANNGGQQPQAQPSQQTMRGSPQGDQPGSIVGLVSSAGIPDELAGPVIQQVSAMTRTDPNATLNPDVAQRVQQVVQAAAQRMRGGQGAPQPASPTQGQPQQAPQVAQAAPQAPQGQPAPQAPSPFANAAAAGLIPPGVDPTRYVAGLKYRAAYLQKGPAQEAIQKQVDAIDKASELTQSQRDYNASQANPKIDERAAQQKGDEATATARAQSDVKEQDGIIADGRSAQTRLNTLNTVANIVQSDKNLTLGFGGETALKLKKALEQMGVNVGDLSGAQTIEKLNAALASEAAKSVSPRPAQFEFRTFLANNPGLSLDKAGNLRVLGIFSQLAKRDVDLGRMARANRDNWDNWDNVVQQYDKNHPILDPVTHTPLSTDSVIAPKAQGTGTTASPAGAVPEGATAFNPKTGERIKFIGGKWGPTA
jgi:hypothetical protein